MKKKKEEEEKEGEDGVGEDANEGGEKGKRAIPRSSLRWFRRARRAGHSSILASRADGLSLPLPLWPSSSSFSSGKLSALSFSVSRVHSLSLSLFLSLSCFFLVSSVFEREGEITLPRSSVSRPPAELAASTLGNLDSSNRYPKSSIALAH